MKPGTHGAVIEHRSHTQHESPPPVRATSEPGVAMDDRDEERELVELLIRHEDLRWGRPMMRIRTQKKGVAA